jgi:hypothetical protein
MPLSAYNKLKFSLNLMRFSINPSDANNLIELIDNKISQLSDELNYLSGVRSKADMDDDIGAIDAAIDLNIAKSDLLEMSKSALEPPKAIVNNSKRMPRVNKASNERTYTPGMFQQARPVDSSPSGDHPVAGKATSMRYDPRLSARPVYADSKIIPLATTLEGNHAEPVTDTNNTLSILEGMRGNSRGAMTGSTARLVDHTITLLNQRTVTATLPPSAP